MKTDIIPKKIVIDFKTDGTFNKGILMYKTLDESGQESKEFNTISINSEVNVPQINALINKAYKFVKGKEKIKEKKSE